jgi:RNA polymerase sigma factor (sigma-70 family)
MAELSGADRYLLDQIRQGSADGWRQFVARYQGRLLAFAQSRLRRESDAEDAVQDTFIQFFRALPTFREMASLETFLFSILRRKLIDRFRGRRMNVCSLQELSGVSGDDSDPTDRLASPTPTASWYASNDERQGAQRSALSSALGELIDRLKHGEKLRDLQIVEMLFYGRLRNQEIARITGIDEKRIALIKHRFLKDAREHVAQRAPGAPISAPGAPISAPGAWANDGEAASMLSEVWEDQRLTCPKRSTVGRFLLGTLEEPWKSYVDFHIKQLGCEFCRANLDDLQRQSANQPRATHDRIYQSTIGFFRHAQ